MSSVFLRISGIIHSIYLIFRGFVCYSYIAMKNYKYMLDNKSFMPFIAVACAVGAGVFMLLARGWDGGAFDIIIGVFLVLSAVTTVAAVVLIGLGLISGISILAPVGLTQIAIILHAVGMLVLRQNYRFRIELLLAVLFAVMILVMLASVTRRKNFEFRRSLMICGITAVVALVCCFIPLILARDNIHYALAEAIELNLPIVFFFAAYVFYFAGLKREGAGEEEQDVQ